MNRKRTAITLVELMVVFFVLAILILISLPALQRAREAARNTQCISNMHQVGVNGFAGTRPLYMFCPVDPTNESRRKANGTSYTLNQDAVGRKNMPLSKTIFGFEAANKFRKKSLSPTLWFSSGKEMSWNRLQDQIAPQRHSNTHANYLYADGHVVSIQVDQIRLWVKKGVNFGLPGQGGYQP